MKTIDSKAEIPDYVHTINQMDFWEKQYVYSHYMITIVASNHIHKSIRSTYILSFPEFSDAKNVKIRDCGLDWKDKGFGQRFWVQTYGIYDWYWKFKDSLTF